MWMDPQLGRPGRRMCRDLVCIRPASGEAPRSSQTRSGMHRRGGYPVAAADLPPQPGDWKFSLSDQNQEDVPELG